MNRLLECVPNFSEGRDLNKIKTISKVIESVPGIQLLNIDSGWDAHRTVITFVGEPEAVLEGAFQSIKIAGQILDMKTQRGVHPRIGSTDVCPLVPIQNLSMEEAVHYALVLGERLGTELNLPIFLYEEAQKNKARSSLAQIRAGEYEGLQEKILLPEWKPDFGPSLWDQKRGATAVGAREILIAYNINLNTASLSMAKTLAAKVRESGSTLGKNHSRIPGSLKSVKAIGWYMKEYGIAQVSMNLTNIRISPLHIVFEEVSKKAQELGLKVTGSELVGLIPLNALLEAARYFLQNQSPNLEEKELVQYAIEYLGLNEFNEFIPEERILEYRIENKKSYKNYNSEPKKFNILKK